MSGKIPVSRALIVLERARKRIARGWCRGHYALGGRYCTVGAIDETATEYCEGNPDLIYETISHIFEALGFAHEAIAVDWNDDETRTQAEVLARFDDAIARLSNAD